MMCVVLCGCDVVWRGVAGLDLTTTHLQIRGIYRKGAGVGVTVGQKISTPTLDSSTIRGVCEWVWCSVVWWSVAGLG